MTNVSSILVWEHATPLPNTSSGRKEVARSVINSLVGATSGAQKAGGFELYPNGTAGVAATGTITLATCLAGTEIEVNGVKFRAIASGTPTIANGEFVISGDDTADAVSLVAAINGSTDAAIASLVTATSALGVVTVTATQKDAFGNAITIKTNGVVASGTVTLLGAQVDDTVTINGTTLTAKQHRATGTLDAGTAIVGTTFSIRGNTFTGVAGEASLGTATFSIDTSDTATATSIAAQINAYAPLSGIVTATSETNRVTIRAVTGGTAGNAIALAGTASVLEASDTTLTGGAAVANNEFEAIGTDTQIAADLVRCIGASTTALVSSHCVATNEAGVVTIRAKYPGTAGNNITLASSDGGRLAVAVTNGRLAGGTDLNLGGTQASGTVTLTSAANGETVIVNGVTITAHTNTQANNQFTIAGDDTADAAALCLAINNSTTAALAEVIATSASNVVTIKARKGGIHGNAITLSSAAGTMVCSVARLASGAVPTTVVPSAGRLTSGVGGSVTRVAHSSF